MGTIMRNSHLGVTEGKGGRKTGMVTMVTIQKEHLSPLKYQEGVTRWRWRGRRVLGKEPNMKKKKKKTKRQPLDHRVFGTGRGQGVCGW